MAVRITAAQARERGLIAPKAERKRDGEMNGTESSYASYLEMRKRAGDVRGYYFESLKLKLAKNTHYTPDFLVEMQDGSIEIHEVKGFWRDDARVKIKIAARLFPMFKFVAVRKVRKTWSFEKIPS